LTAASGWLHSAILETPGGFPPERAMRDLIKLTCQACKRDNYVTDKNKRTMTEKFTIKKFCRACRKHTEHKEGKISKG
jgi:large subunit ribosomal protein L33